MDANKIQIGGVHYQKLIYQHWDFVSDVGLHYLLGCATKYPSRWRDKNGVQDLRKSIHYLEKAKERNIPGIRRSAQKDRFIDRFIDRFTRALPQEERDIILFAVHGYYDDAIEATRDLIDHEISSQEIIEARRHDGV